MKILITGGAGFIGSHVVDACVQRGDEVCIIDNLSSGNPENISQHTGNIHVQFLETDIRDQVKIKEVFEKFRPEVVFHLAAQINVRESIKNPQHDVEVNILGTLNILEAMRAVWCHRMIFSSTGGAMFWGEKCLDLALRVNPPYSEEQNANPETPYGISKRSVEFLLGFYERHYAIESAILRYSNVYWPRQNAQWEAGVVSIFLDKIKNNQAPIIFGDGNQTRDFIHVDDVVSANLHALDQKLTGIYHVGTGIETSVNDLWKILARGFSLTPTYEPALWEIQRSALDSTKLQRTGWGIKRHLHDLTR